MTAILGVNSYHADSSACLLVDGRIVAAAEEERFLRIKHWAGFPRHAIRFCLETGGVDLADVDIIAHNSDPVANLSRKILYAVRHRPSPSLIMDKLRNRRKRRSLGTAIQEQFPDAHFSGRLLAVEHHAAHLASAFLVSPFERASMVSIDAFGDFASCAWGLGEGSDMSVDARILFPHSLGIFYETITHLLGFTRFGDEYKVMGLASYGKPAFLAEMARIVALEKHGRFRLDLACFRHHREKVAFEWDGCEPAAGDYFTPAMEALLGPARAANEPLTQRHMDIACSAQAMYERALFHLLAHVHRSHGCDDLVLAGGCGFNSVANGRIYSHTPFKRVFIQPAAGDAGGALGAALHAWHVTLGGAPRHRMHHAYWGPEYPDASHRACLEGRRAAIVESGCTWESVGEEELGDRVAGALAGGAVVGWFQGRMEWGPRALGNRSILCDPRRHDVKDLLNEKIKRRESFRPFAPSILREAVAEWFETDDDVPFMMKVFRIREERRHLIPAVSHVDGSGRLQTVEREQNPLFYDLIERFFRMTGVPMLLNTSFNENEPIVCAPGEAVECFLRTKMDLLVLGRHLVTRPREPARRGSSSHERARRPIAQ